MGFIFNFAEMTSMASTNHIFSSGIKKRKLSGAVRIQITFLLSTLKILQKFYMYAIVLEAQKNRASKSFEGLSWVMNHF